MQDLPSLHLPFFANLLLLLVLARVFGEVMERFKQPAMIGEILAGVVLGPTVLNVMVRNEELTAISELGVFLLVIIAGLEIDVREIAKTSRGRNLITSLLAFLLTILGVLLDVNNSANSSIDVLGLAIGLTLGKILLLLAGLIFAYRLINKFTDRDNFIELQLDKLLLFMRGKESLLAIMFAFILIFASLTEAVGLHFIIGAFFASMLLSKELVGVAHFQEFEKTTHGMAMGFLAPIFFAGIGLEFQFSSITEWGLLFAIIGVSFLSKIVGGYIGGRFAGLRHRKALTLGIGLNARGIMELVIANIAYREGLIGVQIFSILVIMGVFTTINTPMLLKRSFRWLKAEQ